MYSNRFVSGVQVLAVNELGDDLPELDMDGATQWTAVTWYPPHRNPADGHLACLLLCKGVSKAQVSGLSTFFYTRTHTSMYTHTHTHTHTHTQLPRVNIADWKAGSIGVSTFHCMRCLKNWLKLGALPQNCTEPEEPTEGPAMCMTFSTPSTKSGEMIVGGMVGKDGKPVRIRVEPPQEIKKMLRKEKRKQKEKRLKMEANRGAQQVKDGSSRTNVESHSSDTKYDSDEGEDDNLLDLPESFKKYILKTTAHQESTSKRDINTEESDSVPQCTSHLTGVSSFSSLTSLSSSLFSDSDFNDLIEGIDSYKGKVTGLDSKEYVFDSQDVSPSSSHRLKMATSLERFKETSSLDLFSSCSSDNEERRVRGSHSLHQTHTASANKLKKGGRKTKSITKESSTGLSLPPIIGTMSSINGLDQKTASSRTLNTCHKLSSKLRLSSNGGSAAIISGSSLTVVTSSSGHTGRRKDGSARKRKALYSDGSEQLQDTQMKIRSSISRSAGSGDCVHLPSITDSSSNLTTSKRRRKTYPDRISESRMSSDEASTLKDSTHLPDLNQVGQGNLVTQQKPVSSDSKPADSGESYGGVQPTQPRRNSYSRSGMRDSARHGERRGSHGLHDDLKSRPHRDSGSFADSTMASHRDIVGPRYSTIGETFSSQGPTPVSRNSSRAGNVRKSSSLSSAGFTRSSLVGSQPLSQQNMNRPKISNAVVKQDYELPLNQQRRDSRIRPVRVRRASRLTDLPQGRTPSQCDMNKTLSEHIPEHQDSPHFDISNLHELNDDRTPRRIGRKVVKKSRRGEEQERSSMKYNSKEMGDIISNSITEQNVSNADSDSVRRGSVLSSVAMDDDDEYSKLLESLKAGVSKTTNSLGSGKLPSLLTKDEPSSNHDNSKLVSSGLGSRFLATNDTPPSGIQDNIPLPTAPVQLKPLPPNSGHDSNSPLTTDEHLNTDGENKDGFLEQTEGGVNPDHDEDGGLEVIMEEDEEDSDDELYDIKPLTELKPISDLCFTSGYAYSFFRMGGVYKEAYNKVHRRAVQPLNKQRRTRIALTKPKRKKR